MSIVYLNSLICAIPFCKVCVIHIEIYRKNLIFVLIARLDTLPLKSIFKKKVRLAKPMQKVKRVISFPSVTVFILWDNGLIAV